MTNPNTPTGASAAVTDEMVAAATKHSRIDSHGQFIPIRAIKDVYLAMRALEPPPSSPASVVTVPRDVLQTIVDDLNAALAAAQPRDLEGENKMLRELIKLKDDALEPFAKEVPIWPTKIRTMRRFLLALI